MPEQISKQTSVRRALAAFTAVLAATVVLAAAAEPASADVKKAIWGPLEVGGESLFPTYADLGTGIVQVGLSWQSVAPTRPANPTNPGDPAYNWPTIDSAIAEAQKYGMQIAVLLSGSPGWANGGRAPNWAPNNPRDFATFAAAASRRYPGVHQWLIWGEPSVREHFQPLGKTAGPRRYARLLDAAYGALKRVSPANLVIGGNTISYGQTKRGTLKPLDFIKGLQLPNGKPPRMDMYGHNPFSFRKPDLKLKPKYPGTADMSDLDTLTQWLDRYLHRGNRDRKLKLFLSEYTLPSDHLGTIFPYWASRETVAEHLSAALRIARAMPRVYTLGWFYLIDEPPNAAGNENDWGLMDWKFQKKPAYFAFKAG